MKLNKALTLAKDEGNLIQELSRHGRSKTWSEQLQHKNDICGNAAKSEFGRGLSCCVQDRDSRTLPQLSPAQLFGRFSFSYTTMSLQQVTGQHGTFWCPFMATPTEKVFQL